MKSSIVKYADEDEAEVDFAIDQLRHTSATVADGVDVAQLIRNAVHAIGLMIDTDAEQNGTTQLSADIRELIGIIAKQADRIDGRPAKLEDRIPADFMVGPTVVVSMPGDEDPAEDADAEPTGADAHPNDYEYVCDATAEDGDYLSTSRLRVPGGWLYRVYGETSADRPVLSTTFVPDLNAEHVK